VSVLPTDVSGRALALEPAGLEHFFHPERVAVLGASDAEGRPTTLYWRMLRGWGDRVGAEVVPVNPNRPAVDGVPCAATLDDVAGEIDVVAVLVGDALAGVRAAAGRGARFAVVFSAGFAETGAAGRAAQEELVAAARASASGRGMRLLGPNTNLNAFEEFRTDLAGPALGVITQSGHQGRPLFQLQENGVRVAAWAPTGNEADLDAADFLAHFADLAGEPDLGAVAAYIEGFRDGRAFQLAADRCAQAGLPVVAVKVGRSEVGRRGVGTHTGKLAGSDRVTDAVFRQVGVTRVDGLDELGATATFLARAPAAPRRGGGVVVYSISGGTGAHLSDLLAAGGVPLRRLSASTRARLRQWIPAGLGVDNPVDCGGPPVGDERGPAILDALVADPRTAALLVAVAGPFPPLSDRLAADVVALAERTDVPVCVLWGSPTGTEPALRDVLLASPRVTVFRTSATAVGALRAWFEWHAFRARYRSPFASAPGRRSAGASFPLGDGPYLSEHDSKRLLAAYGIAVTDDRLATSENEAVRAAGEIGGAVVLKACGPAVTHKSDHGLVITGLDGAGGAGAGPGAVRSAYRTLVERAEGVAPLDGVLVCPQEPPGCELVLGIADDEVFGPVVMVGLGGVLVEVLGDVGMAVPPFTAADAGRVLDGLRGAPILRGARGAPPVDRRAVVDAMLRLQRLALEHGDRIASVDANPVVARPRGQGLVALDALVALR
jgi:acyl-CoA synthetase (NDP forming)